MKEKKIPLIILLVSIFVVYGLFYVAVSFVVIPLDLETYEYQSSNIAVLNLQNEANILELDNLVMPAENGYLLSYMSPEQRTQMANDMKSKNVVPGMVLDRSPNFFDNFLGFKALLYNIALKGDISNDLNNISSTYDDLYSTGKEINDLNEKMVKDIENGDDKAYAEDLKNMIMLIKEYDTEISYLQTHLQAAVDQMGG